jgi:hypothetical protein
MFEEIFHKCGKTYVVIGLAEDWQYPARKKKITLDDVAKYFAHQAGSLSGCRSLAGITGDWRCIDNIAQDVLAYFKHINIEGMRRSARRYGLVPKF